MRIFTFLLLLSFSFFAKAQDAQAFQNELNAEYLNPEKSPLSEEDLAKFTALPFFPIDEKYHVMAHFERTPMEKPFQMATTTKRKPIYVKYGIARFKLDGKEYSLTIFQNISLKSKQGFEDYLFLPFKDETNGLETYGGGRYVDLRIPKIKDSIEIDFNKSYNPYCAYSHRFSCPVVPAYNDLKVRISAGVMLQDDWHLVRKKELGFIVRFPEEPAFTEVKSTNGLEANINRYRFLAEFDIDSNFVFQLDVKQYTSSTCPQPSGQFYNDCFTDILAEKLRETHGALMFIRRLSVNGHDAYEFELLAQGKAFSKYKVVLIGNKAYILSVTTIRETQNNLNMDRFFDSFHLY